MKPTTRTPLSSTITALALFAALSGTAAAQAPTRATIPNPIFNEVGDTILAAISRGEIPSMSVAVAQDGSVVWEESFGWVNREELIPATPQTLYSMGFISKPMTTTGLMVLRERGLLDLADPVNRYSLRPG